MLTHDFCLFAESQYNVIKPVVFFVFFFFFFWGGVFLGGPVSVFAK